MDETTEDPVAADRPVVDATAASPRELREAVAWESDPRRAEIERMRQDLGAAVGALVTRLDLRTRLRVARIGGRVVAAVAVGAALLVIVLRRRARA